MSMEKVKRDKTLKANLKRGIDLHGHKDVKSIEN
jgi:hypothetical protein